MKVHNRSQRREFGGIPNPARRRFGIEALEPRRLLVTAFDTTILLEQIETPAEMFTGVGEVDNPQQPPGWCTGTLLPSGRQFLTAAHCVDDVMSGQTWHFNLEESFPFTANDVFIHPGFTNISGIAWDVAIVDLVPDPCNDQCLTELDESLQSVTRYDVFRGDDEVGRVTDLVGFGRGGEGKLGVGNPLYPGGVKRNGMNKIEILTDQMEAEIPGQIVHPNSSQLALDFDAFDPISGGELTDCSTVPEAGTCDAFGHYLNINDLGFDNSGPGYFEVGLNGGDSGGPWFVDQVASDGVHQEIAGIGAWIYRFLESDYESGSIFFGNFGEVTSAMRVSWLGDDGVHATDCLALFPDPDAPDGHLDWIDCTFDIIAPKVEEVRFETTETLHGPYEVLGGFANNKATQLKTVPIARANELYIRFSEDVEVEEQDLEVFGRTTLINYHNQFAEGLFDYDEQTFTAKWTFDPPLADETVDQIELHLANVTDRNNVPLDAEWVNPMSITDPNGSVFPSGNDNAADGTGVFVFYVNFIPADFNQDAVVDALDFLVWNDHRFTGGHGPDSFLSGDATGDRIVDGADFTVWNQWKFQSFAGWPGGQQQASSGGGSGPSAAWLDAYDRLLERHEIFNGGLVNSSLATVDWDRFAFELTILLRRL